MKKKLLAGLMVLGMFVAEEGKLSAATHKPARATILVAAKVLEGEEGLVAWWSFDEANGNIAEDKTGNGNNGIVEGAQRVPGKMGSALMFDGADDYVNCGASEMLFRPNITIEAWVKPATADATAVVAGYRPNYKGYMFLTSRFSVYDGEEEDSSANYVVEPGVWNHIVGTFDGATVKVYKNGELVDSAPQDGFVVPGINFIIGKASHYDGAYFNGLIDEVKVFNRALSEEEIHNKWEAAIAGKVKEGKEYVGIYAALADNGFYNYEHYSHTNQRTVSHQIKKIVDLSGLQDEIWSKVKSIEVSLFMYAEDNKGDGLDETFDILVNGHVNTFPTESLVKSGRGWYDHYIPIGWFDFPIPKRQFTKGVNEIIVRKSSPTTDYDDQIKIGIDIFRRLNCSFSSSDRGRNWQDRPLNRDGFAGEYMVRLNLYLFKGKRTFSHDKLPSLPPIDLNPAVKSLPKVPPGQPVVYKPGREYDLLENGWMRIKVSLSKGISLKEITHKPMGVNAIRGQDKSNLFLIEIDGEKYYSEHFTVKTKKVLSSKRNKCEVLYHLHNNTLGIGVDLHLEMDQTQELKIGMSINNSSKKLKKTKVAFPLLTGIGWSADFADDHYMFPFMSGAILKKPSKFISAYGGHFTYFQQMVSYSPKAGGGIYLRVNDKSGAYKLLHFTKTDSTGREPTFRFKPIIVNMHNGRARQDLVLLEPLPGVPGTNMAFTYFGRELKPGDNWAFKPAVLGLMNGDWHEAMDSYRNWYESWSYKRPYPNKLTNIFNLASANIGGEAEGFRTDFIDRNGWSPAKRKNRNPDAIETVSYWEWDEVTDEYLVEMKAIAERYGKEFVLWPGRHSMHEGKHYYYTGRMGDYGSTGYIERWGGLPAFRKYLNEIKKKGMLATLYINEGEAGLNSVLGKKFGPQWCVMYPKGQYFWPYWMWEMCIDNPLRRKWLAETCKRLIEETGADGIRIDEFGGAQRICYNPEHSHTFSRPEHYAVIQAQADACRQIRKAVDETNPEAILMTETPGIDLMWQYINGSLSYDLAMSPLTGSRAKDWEGFVGVNLNRFYFPRFKFFDDEREGKHPAWMFFNATGAFNRFWFYKDQELQILKENSDAFTSLDPTPMIPTLMPMVYINKFPGKNKTVYTVYNGRKTPVEGDLLAVDTVEGFHFVDLYNHLEVRTTERGNKTTAAIELDGRSVTCLAYLPNLMEVFVDRGLLKVKTREAVKDAVVKIVGPGGEVFSENRMQSGKCSLSLPDVGRVICKLYSGKRLVDALLLGR